MKRIVIANGNELCYNTLNFFADSVGNSLKKKGFEVGFINIGSGLEVMKSDFERELNQGIDAMLCFNADNNLFSFIEVLNAFNIPFYDWIVDHPCEHIKILNAPINNFNVICLDMDHADFIKKYIRNIKTVKMIPLGGYVNEFGREYDIDQFLGRKYDLVFTGSYVPVRRFESSILSLPDRMKKMTVRMIEYMIEKRNANNEEALNNALREIIGSDELDEELYQKCAYYTSNSNIYVRHYIREEIMRYLVESGVRVDIFGPGWDLLGFDRMKNVVLHDRIDYMESVDVCSDAKLCLNIMPWFKNGLHDRISTAMLNGAAVITDSSKYIDKVFCPDGEKQDICLYSISNPDMLPDTIYNLLSDYEKLYTIAERGNKKAKENMTWEERVNELISMFACNGIV